MILEVEDIWHREGSEGFYKTFVYSSDFESLEDFLAWVFQHQKDLSGVTCNTK